MNTSSPQCSLLVHNPGSHGRAPCRIRGAKLARCAVDVGEALPCLPSLCAQPARGALAAAIAPGVPGGAVGRVAGVRVLDDQVDQRLRRRAARPCAQVAALSIHISGVSMAEGRVHAERDGSGEGLQRVVAAVGIAGEVGLAHAADERADAAPVGQGRGVGEEQQIAAGHEGVGQARGRHLELAPRGSGPCR